jgi:hypothetical protein
VPFQAYALIKRHEPATAEESSPSSHGITTEPYQSRA